MTSDTLRKFLIGVVLGQFMLFGVVFVTSHNGRQAVVQNSRDGCENRSKLDREAIIAIAASVYDGFLNTDTKLNKPITSVRQQAEHELHQAAVSLASRTGNHLDCAKAFPDAGWFPWSDSTSKITIHPVLPPVVPASAPVLQNPK